MSSFVDYDSRQVSSDKDAAESWTPTDAESNV